MESFFGDCAREELVRALVFMRSRLGAVLKEKSDLTTQLDTAGARIDRLTQEKYQLENRAKEYVAYNKEIVQAHNELLQKHREDVEHFNQRTEEIVVERQKLKLEKEDLAKLWKKAENCLAKTRVAFIELKRQKKEEIKHFINMGLGVEKRLAETRAAYTELQKEVTEKNAQLQRFASTDMEMEQQLAEAWATAESYARKLENLRNQHEILKRRY